MGFKVVWGFDPDEVAKAQALSRGVAQKDQSLYCIDDEPAAQIRAMPSHKSSNFTGSFACRNSNVGATLTPNTVEYRNYPG